MRSRNCFLDLPEFRPHTVPTGFPLKLEGTATGVPTNEDETQEGEGLWLAEPPPLTIGHRVGVVSDRRQNNSLLKMNS
jgi:hypothetical protein